MNISFHVLNKKLLTNLIFKNFFHRTNCLKQNGENVTKALFKKLQKEAHAKRKKVSIIGSGKTGIAVAYNLIIGNHCDEVILVDKKGTEAKLKADMLDLIYCRSIHKAPDIQTCVDFTKCKDSRLIIVTAGKAGQPNKSGSDVAKDNVAIFKEIIPILAKHSPEAVFLIVSNPCDITTYATLKYSKFPPNRVIGVGCEVDRARFRYHISKRLGINHASVNAYIIGEHGKTAVPCWSSVNVAGTNLRDIDCTIAEELDRNNWKALAHKTIKDDELVISLKGWTNFTVSFCIEHIAQSILSDLRKVHCVSVLAKGCHGIKSDVCLSLPCVIGSNGVEFIVSQTLNRCEKNRLKFSANSLQESIKKLGL